MASPVPFEGASDQALGYPSRRAQSHRLQRDGDEPADVQRSSITEHEMSVRQSFTRSALVLAATSVLWAGVPAEAAPRARLDPI